MSGSWLPSSTLIRNYGDRWKELIDWDQARQDVEVKYEQVFEQFDASNMIDDKVQNCHREQSRQLPHRSSSAI